MPTLHLSQRHFQSLATLVLYSLIGCESTQPEPIKVSERVLSPNPIADNSNYLPLPPRTLSLTFDDGPDTNTQAIADYLYQQGIRATFFVNGCRFQGTVDTTVTGSNCYGQNPKYDPSILDYLVVRGHRIANHTLHHLSLAGSSSANLSAQLKPVQDILDPHIHDGVYLFRAPYGNWSPATASAAHLDPSLDKLIGPFSWDIHKSPGPTPGGDWECALNGATPEACADGYKAAIDDRPNHNGIILLHDRNEFSVGTDFTLRFVKRLVALLPRPNYLFVPLDALPGNVFPNPPLIWTNVFSNADGWANDSSRYGSIRLANVDGDPGKRADVCGRDPTLGLRCAISNGNGFASPTTWLSTEYADAQGWAAEKYGSTIQLGDLNGDGKADVCGRGSWGMRCALSTGSGFGPATWWSQGLNFTDSDGWDAGIKYYGTIRLGDINADGKADVCGRSSWGIVCALSDGQRFGAASTWSWDFSDPAWGPSEYATTLQLADINGDQRADICGRGPSGIVCATASSAGSFINPKLWTPPNGIYSNADGWASPAPAGLSTAASKYRSIDFADINQDGRADICGRNETGIACALSNGTDFVHYRYVVHNDFTDASGWGNDAYGTTVQLADIDGNGRADVCGRGFGGMFCARGLIP